MSIPGTGLSKRTYYSKSRKRDEPYSNDEMTTREALITIALLASIFSFVFGHWLLGIFGIVAMLAILSAKTSNKMPISSENALIKEKDWSKVGNIPQETLDYLESKAKRRRV